MSSKTNDLVVIKSILKEEITKSIKASEKRLKEEIRKELEVNNKILELNIKAEMDERFRKAEEVAQKRHNQIFDLVDGLAGEVKASHEERIVSGSRISTNSQRIDKLEKKVFGSIQTP